MGSYVVSTPAEQQAMLQEIGHSSMAALYHEVPAGLMLQKLNLPAGLSELELQQRIQDLAAQNTVYSTVFRGAGAYDHYIPAVVKHVAGKEEFVTAYTPYQAELSQGGLQVIFEFQSLICELTGLDIANASVYDGATAAAEAAIMCRGRNRNRVLVAESVHPDTLETLRAYSFAGDDPLATVPLQGGRIDTAKLGGLLGEDVSCLILQQPNYYGLMEDVDAVVEAAHAAGVKVVLSCNPTSLGLFKSPAEYGADIAVGDGQPFGMPLSFGGPYLGFMACTKALMRQLPGRIVGETVDADGKRAFVLTLQAREQHIKREKALSSICSNQALCALTATAYLGSMGPQGLAEVAQQCYAKAHYAAGQIAALPGFGLRYTGEFYHEFVTECPVPAAEVNARLAEKGILGGLPVEGNGLLWCCTEKQSKAQIDALVAVLKEVAK